jgi:hypothetical protein
MMGAGVGSTNRIGGRALRRRWPPAPPAGDRFDQRDGVGCGTEVRKVLITTHRAPRLVTNRSPDVRARFD